MKGYGGMVSFEVGRRMEDAERFIRKLKIPKVAASLGSVESLVTIPAQTSHRQMSPAERRGRGISDCLVRLSVGVEDCEDLIEDMSSALGK